MVGQCQKGLRCCFIIFFFLFNWSEVDAYLLYKCGGRGPNMKNGQQE